MRDSVPLEFGIFQGGNQIGCGWDAQQHSQVLQMISDHLVHLAQFPVGAVLFRSISSVSIDVSLLSIGLQRRMCFHSPLPSISVWDP